MPPPPPRKDDDCGDDDVTHPAGQEWVEREMRRLSQNQHDLRETIHAYQLKHTEALSEQTRELADRITTAQKETSKEVGEVVAKAEEGISVRFDKVEAKVAENERKADEVKKELNGVNVKVAVWCAFGTIAGTIITSVIAGIIIHSIGK